MVINLGAQECSEGYCSGPVCVCVCVCVLVCLFVVFCHHVNLDPKISVRMGSPRDGKNFFAKNALIGRYGICLPRMPPTTPEPKIRTPTESAQHGHDIAIQLKMLSSEVNLEMLLRKI